MWKKVVRFDCVLLLILLLSLVVRLWGIDFGLPHIGARPDESKIIGIAMRFGTRDFNPHFFHYPTLYMYLLLFFYVLYYVFGSLVGRYASLASFVGEFSLDPTSFYLIARVFSALFGAATVVVTYKLAKELFGKRIAFIASFFLAFAHLHVRESHFGKVDILGTFLVVCSMIFIAKIFKNKTWKNYALAGLFGGLSMSVRYAGVLLVLPMAVVHAYHALGKKGKRLRALFDKKMAIFAGVFGLAFLFGTPFSLFDFRKFISDILFLSDVITRPYYGVWVGRGWWYHLRVSLFYGLGWSMFLASFAGILVLFRRDYKKAILLLVFPFSYYALMGKAHTAFVRYAVPLLPFMCITGGYFVEDVGRRLKRFVPSVYRAFLVFILSFLVILPSFLSACKFDRLLAKKDSRLIAADWIYENLDGGSSMYQVGTWLGTVQLFPSLSSLQRQLKASIERSSKEGRLGTFKQIASRARLSYLEREGIDGFNQWDYDNKLGKFTFKGGVQESLPKYIVSYKTPLEVDRLTSPVPKAIPEMLKESYSLIKSFQAVNIEAGGNVYDQQDAFYVPYAGFKNIERPGPNIYIYQKT